MSENIEGVADTYFISSSPNSKARSPRQGISLRRRFDFGRRLCCIDDQVRMPQAISDQTATAPLLHFMVLPIGDYIASISRRHYFGRLTNIAAATSACRHAEHLTIIVVAGR